MPVQRQIRQDAGYGIFLALHGWADLVEQRPYEPVRDIVFAPIPPQAGMNVSGRDNPQSTVCMHNGVRLR